VVLTRLAVLQTSSPSGDPDAALARLAAPLAAAGAAGAAVLVAPELFLPGYNSDRMATLAQPRGGAWHRALSDLCRSAGCGLVTGYAERDGDALFNSAVAFAASGAEVAHYRKVQLYGTREKCLFTPGDAYAVFDVAGVPAAMLICYDVEFAPHVAALASRGVEIILVPTANMAPFTHVVEATVPAMAANHAVAIAYANYAGTEGDLTYVGGSQIVGPHGETLAMAGAGPALLVADLPERDRGRLSSQASDFRHVRPA
jgi:predicted amidohydrolase